MVKHVALVRVSTDKQEQSGLGLDAQMEAIHQLRATTGAELLKVYKETESGTHDDIESRPQLRAAVSHAKRANATLVIAKIDRLVRSTQIMAYLKKTRVRFIACDNPHANELTIDILVAVAADEARRISQRTKDALKAYKAGNRVSKRLRSLYPDGVPAEIVEATAGRLGASLPQCRNLTDEARALGTARSVAARRAKATEGYADLAPYMAELRAQGQSLKQIAEALTAEGQATARNRAWSPTQVMRVLRRFGNQPSRYQNFGE